MYEKWEKNFTWLLLERHNSKLTSLLSSSVWLWIHLAISCICRPRQSCPLTLKVYFSVKLFRGSLRIDTFCRAFIPSEYSLRPEAGAGWPSTRLRRDLWRDTDPKCFYSTESPIPLARIRAKLISDLSRCHNVPERYRISSPFKFSYVLRYQTRRRRRQNIRRRIKSYSKCCCFTSGTNRACNT